MPAGLTMTVLNPPKGARRKGKRRASAKQIAWRKKFGARFGGGKKKKGKRSKRRTGRAASTTTKVTPMARKKRSRGKSSSKRYTTIARASRRRGSRRRGSRRAFLRTDLMSDALTVGTLGLSATAGFAASHVGGNKLAAKLDFMKNADGTHKAWMKNTVRGVAGALVVIAPRLSRRTPKLLKTACDGFAAGITANIGTSILAKHVPQMELPAGLSGDFDTGRIDAGTLNALVDESQYGGGRGVGEIIQSYDPALN